MSYDPNGSSVPDSYKAAQPGFAIGRGLYVKVAGCREAIPLSTSLQLIYIGAHSPLYHPPNYQHDQSPASPQFQHWFEAVLSCLDTPSLKEINLPKSE